MVEGLFLEAEGVAVVVVGLLVPMQCLGVKGV